MNKYTRWYNQIVEQAQNRITEGYTERHHIQPRSLGGADTPDNLVNLTAREHFVCHWLLTKMTSGEDRYKMLNALRMMRAEKEGQQRYATAITSRVYESIKQEYAELQSILRSGEGNGFYGKTHTVEARRRISEANKGRIQPPDEKEKQIAAITGRKRKPFSEEWRAKMAEKKKGENNPRYGATVSEETKEKMRAKALGRKQSEETVRKKVEAVRGSKREKKLCPHCGEMIAVNTYSRWHGPKCRHQTQST
jgi:ribosomal protein S27AE